MDSGVHSKASWHFVLFHQCNLLNRNKYQILQAGCRFLSFKLNKLLIFLVDHLTAISQLWWKKCFSLSKNLFTVFPLSETKFKNKNININFWILQIKSQELLVHILFCLLINLWWNCEWHCQKKSVRKAAKRYFSLIFSFSSSKFMLIWKDRFRSPFIVFILS